MLKILDNVNINILTAYGFKKKNNTYVKKLLNKKSKRNLPEITLEIIDNKDSIYNRFIFLYCGGIKRNLSNIFYDCFDVELDTIYDLIQAKLVERIEVNVRNKSRR